MSIWVKLSLKPIMLDVICEAFQKTTKEDN